ncbi:hypothetical protein STCU_10414 [Strigomonas culicis]|uniref:Uncharacterized protein n=1 Tax=Strigomonas culicis TaxID=28005 RepID=S9V4G2_9TRYP|nr:hypothetical protein STCU_10414 [Strigomonas culicis]|eukprot:EPY17765.1 hypothetical protein STCU_10414 [Strigomonas culicis]
MSKLQTNALRVAAAAGAALLLYRGVVLYLRNDITITVTELVRFPTLYIHSAHHNEKKALKSANPGYTNVAVKGKVSMMNCTMRSYRFLLKLTCRMTLQNSVSGVLGAVNNANANATSADRTNNITSARSRVTNSFASSARGTGGYYDSAHSNLMLTSSGSPTASNQGSFLYSRTDSAPPNVGGGAKPSKSTTTTTAECDQIHEMIDFHELLQHQNVAFTPACVSEEALFSYTTTAAKTNVTTTTSGDDGEVCGFDPSTPSVRLQQVDLSAHSSAPNAVCLSFYVLF